MPRLKLIGDLPQALAGGPMWEPGEEQDLTKAAAAPYLTNANWQVVEPPPPAEEKLADESTPAVEAPVAPPVEAT